MSTLTFFIYSFIFYNHFLFKSSTLPELNYDPEASIPSNHTVSFFDNSALLDNVLESSNVENDLGNFIASEFGLSQIRQTTRSPSSSEFGLSPFLKSAKRKSEEIHQQNKVLKTGEISDLFNLKYPILT
jgi:hypothetical protein